MKVNGKVFDYEKNTTVLDLLEKIGVKKDRVVVEINQEIISSEKYSTYILKEDDVIEVISFVGGG